MDIIIGRNDSDGRLLLTVNGNNQLAATPGSVPPSVGTTHCTLTINNGKMRLKNLDINNYTYINSQSIESKAVTKDDQITLGSDGYLLDWNLLKPILPTDIRHLHAFCMDYSHHPLHLSCSKDCLAYR